MKDLHPVYETYGSHCVLSIGLFVTILIMAYKLRPQSVMIQNTVHGMFPLIMN